MWSNTSKGNLEKLKIKRCALINDIEDGGLKMLDIQSMILARRVLIFKRYVDDKYESPWKVILDYFLSGVGEFSAVYQETKHKRDKL